MIDPKMSDDDAFALLKSALAPNDHTFTYWPQKSVELARARWKRDSGGVPDVASVKAHFGARYDALLPRVIAWREFDNALKGYKSGCHYCGSDSDLTYWDFALMRVERTKHNIGGTLALVALSAIALPLIGAAALKLPGKAISGAAFHLKLVSCKPCCRQQSAFGLFVLNEQRASHHPKWSSLHEAGFTKFLTREKMPDSFRFDIGQHL